jgi:CRP-like cAMP-binding protein
MALDDDIALFSGHPLLGALEREAMRLVAFSTDRRSFRAGDVLARKGEGADTSFLIVSGQLALSEHDDGRPAERVVGPGALVGELALFCETLRPATVLAREAVTVLVLRRDVMARVLREFPGSAAAVHAAISQDLQRFTAAIAPIKERMDRVGE